MRKGLNSAVLCFAPPLVGDWTAASVYRLAVLRFSVGQIGNIDSIPQILTCEWVCKVISVRVSYREEMSMYLYIHPCVSATYAPLGARLWSLRG